MLAHPERASHSLFGFMARNARWATEYFGTPPDHVVELGAQIKF